MNELTLHENLAGGAFEGATRLNATDREIEKGWAGPLASDCEERIQYLRGRRAFIKKHDRPSTPIQQMGFNASPFCPDDVEWRRREMSKERN